MPSTSGGVLRHSTRRHEPTARGIGFYALNVGRGIATGHDGDGTCRARASVSMPSMSGGVLRPVGVSALDDEWTQTRFLCPQCRAGYCDRMQSRFVDGLYHQHCFYALNVGRGIATDALATLAVTCGFGVRFAILPDR